MTLREKGENSDWQGLKDLPPMDDGEFSRWRNLLEDRTGMILPDERRSFLVTNLGIRMREIGCSNYQEYLDYLQMGRRGIVEWTTLVDRLTVHETRFFRHKNSIHFLKKHFLPSLIESSDPPYNIHVWSVGCATGEEPYTLAIVIDKYMSSKNVEYYMGVTATDISLASLAVGRRGIYQDRKLTEMEKPTLRCYLTRVDERHFKVNADIRDRVCFAQMNVLEADQAPIGKMDLIYCQNLLIYFNRERRIRILNSLADHLNPGGMLVLGSGEILSWTHPMMERVSFESTLVFCRKPEDDDVQSSNGTDG